MDKSNIIAFILSISSPLIFKGIDKWTDKFRPGIWFYLLLPIFVFCSLMLIFSLTKKLNDSRIITNHTNNYDLLYLSGIIIVGITGFVLYLIYKNKQKKENQCDEEKSKQSAEINSYKEKTDKLDNDILRLEKIIADYRKSDINEWNSEHESFKIEANNKLDSDFATALCAIRSAFHDIEEKCNDNFQRGQLVYDYLKRDYWPFPGQAPGKITTVLESDLYEIYIKYITEEKFPFPDNIYTDIYPVKNKNDAKNYRWIIDVLDGGFHFVNNIPLFTSTIAFQTKETVKKKEKETKEWITQLGATYILLTQEIFFAVKDKGAYLNNWEEKNKLPLGGKRREEVKNSIFYIEFPNKKQKERPDGKFKESCELLKMIFPKVNKVRGFNLGSFGLAYLAKGSFDAYISLSGATSFYDSMAGELLVKESFKRSEKSDGMFLKKHVDTSDKPVTISFFRIFASSKKIYESLIKGDVVVNKSLDDLFKDIDIKIK